MYMEQKKKKGMVIAVSAAVVIVAAAALFLLFSQKASPKKTFEEFASLLEKGSYEEMYAYISSDAKKAWTKEDFVKRYSNIFSGIEATDVKISVGEEKEGQISYTESMRTVAGEISFTHEAKLVSEEEDGKDVYRIAWNSSYVFPEMEDSDYVSVSIDKGERGKIEDRNGVMLAGEGTVYKVGIVAGSSAASQDAQKKLAELLSMDRETIASALKASWVQDGMFVPVRTISSDTKKKLDSSLSSMEGVQIQEASGRVYPYGEISAHITGYVQSVTAEDLEKHKGEGYTSSSVIGKSGLEAVYEKQLKETDGAVITIYKQDGSVKKVLAQKEAKNGKNIRTTIDIKIQQAVYEELKKDAGSSVVMNSKSGEVLALVSTPSYDPQDFALGMDAATWTSLSENKDNPLLNRTTSLYTPGSVFKLVSGAIGLDSKTITSATSFEKTEKWQKDESWGDNYVTTTEQYTEPSNLKNAYIYSDNIFFAQLADKIGSKSFTAYLDKFGFKKDLGFELGASKSSYGEHMDDVQKLTAAAYGQGDLQMSPLHLTSIYTSLVNDGSLLKPYLVYDNGEKKVLAENAFSKDTAKTIYADLQATMDHYGSNPTKAAGKTGTAEIDNGKETIGWTCAVNEDIAITMMVDRTKEVGYSHYVLPKVQKLLSELK